MDEGRDHWWHELMADGRRRVPGRAAGQRAPLFILYTSGSTGKPKGIMHTTAGYLTQVAFTHKYVFDLTPTTTSSGARPTSAGSPATATSSTARWPTARRS